MQGTAQIKIITFINYHSSCALNSSKDIWNSFMNQSLAVQLIIGYSILRCTYVFTFMLLCIFVPNKMKENRRKLLSIALCPESEFVTASRPLYGCACFSIPPGDKILLLTVIESFKVRFNLLRIVSWPSFFPQRYMVGQSNSSAILV